MTVIHSSCRGRGVLPTGGLPPEEEGVCLERGRRESAKGGGGLGRPPRNQSSILECFLVTGASDVMITVGKVNFTSSANILRWAVL